MDAVADAHYVVLALPETAGSIGLFGRKMLAAMRSDAVLLLHNFGRAIETAD